MENPSCSTSDPSYDALSINEQWTQREDDEIVIEVC
jgi:hypothetical protein